MTLLLPHLFPKIGPVLHPSEHFPPNLRKILQVRWLCNKTGKYLHWRPRRIRNSPAPCLEITWHTSQSEKSVNDHVIKKKKIRIEWRAESGLALNGRNVSWKCSPHLLLAKEWWTHSGIRSDLDSLADNLACYRDWFPLRPPLVCWPRTRNRRVWRASRLLLSRADVRQSFLQVALVFTSSALPEPHLE